MLLNTYKHHHTETLFIFTIFVPIFRTSSIYVVSMWSWFFTDFSLVMLTKVLLIKNMRVLEKYPVYHHVPYENTTCIPRWNDVEIPFLQRFSVEYTWRLCRTRLFVNFFLLITVSSNLLDSRLAQEPVTESNEGKVSCLRWIQWKDFQKKLGKENGWNQWVRKVMVMLQNLTFHATFFC